MEDRITAWDFSGGGSPTPLLIYSNVAERFGLQNGSKITDKATYEQVIEQNQSREACSIESQAAGVPCDSCGS